LMLQADTMSLNWSTYKQRSRILCLQICPAIAWNSGVKIVALLVSFFFVLFFIIIIKIKRETNM
jgi:hypothetical protein